MESPQSRDIAKDNFIKDLENFKASIHNIKRKTSIARNDLHTTSTQDPKLYQDGDTKKDEKVNKDVLHGRHNHQNTREAETASDTKQDPPKHPHTSSTETSPPLAANPNDTKKVATKPAQANKPKTPDLFQLPDFRKHPQSIRTLMMKSITPFETGIRQIKNLIQKVTTTRDTTQRCNYAQQINE